MKCDDMADIVVMVRISSTTSNVDSYQWVCNAVHDRLEALRLESQESEMIAAYRPDAVNPITPSVETRKDNAKGKLNRDTSKETCQ